MNASRPERVHIMGGAGSGKSYLAERLGRALDLPICDLDDLFWASDQNTYDVPAKPDQRDERLRQFVARNRWIVEGVYHQWVGESFQRADVILLLTPRLILRDGRIVRRFLFRKFGFVETTKKETLAGLVSLIRWNHAYDGDNLGRALACLKPHEHKLHTFSSADQAAAFVLGL